MSSYNSFSENIMSMRYSHTKPDGTKETWPEIAHRVATEVMSVVPVSKDTVREIEHVIAERKFIPGGRFLAQAGRPFHMTSNCISGDGKVPTSNGLKRMRDISVGDEIVTRSGRFSKVVSTRFTGNKPVLEIKAEGLPKIKMTQEHRVLTQRGWVESQYLTERDFVLTPLHNFEQTPPKHIFVSDAISSDIPTIISGGMVYKKNSGRRVESGETNEVNQWANGVTNQIEINKDLMRLFGLFVAEGCTGAQGKFVSLTFSAKEKDFVDESVSLLKSIFGVDSKVSDKTTYYQVIAHSVILSDFFKSVFGGRANTKKIPEWMFNLDRDLKLVFLSGVFDGDGYNSANSMGLTLANQHLVTQIYFMLIGLGVGASLRYIDSVKSEMHTPTASIILRPDNGNMVKFMSGSRDSGEWHKIISVTDAGFDDVYDLQSERDESFVVNGMVVHNCFMYRAEDTREGWGSLMRKSTVSLMSGGGIGVDYSDIRPKGALLKRSGGTSSGVLPLCNVVNEIGRGVMAGGNRRSAIYASLRWSHDDVFDFIRMKDWPEYIKKQKELDFDTPAKMDMTNISVILDKDFFDACDDPSNPMHNHAREVYWAVVENMVKTAEPGFQVDYNNKRESLRNA